MVVGCRGTVTINPRHLMLQEASMTGIMTGVMTPQQYREIGCAIVAGIESGWVNPVINKVYGMTEVQQVHYDIIHNKGAKGKLVIKISNLPNEQQQRYALFPVQADNRQDIEYVQDYREFVQANGN